MGEFKKPPQLNNANGQQRRVGVEIEFAKMDLETATSITHKLFGGQVHQVSPFEYRIEDARYGNFKVVLDSAIVRDNAYKKVLGSLGIKFTSETRSNFEDLVTKVSNTIVPYEIITPPIPISQLEVIEELRQALHFGNAHGTKASPFSAFGLHFNPETPTLNDTGLLLNFIRAYILLHEWLLKISNVDFKRKISPFIDHFENDYIHYVLNPAYKPDMRHLIKDYVYYNPTRHRALDMLPLFAVIDEQAIGKEELEKMLIKRRPTFHYRLPNSMLEHPDWRISTEWNRWVLVETLANDPALISELTAEFIDSKAQSFEKLNGHWIGLISESIRKLESKIPT